MKAALLGFIPLFLLGCSANVDDIILNARTQWTQTHSHPHPVPNPVPDPGPVAKAVGPFSLDSGTVLLADFNGDLVNRVTGISGSLRAGAFAPALFGSGVRMQDGATGKYGVDFPNTEAFSLQSGIHGSLEALVWADAAQPGFAHIIEKAWQYAISVYDGKLAVDFGTDWWYSQVALPLGEWSYVAATYDGQTLRLYLNGALAESTPYAGYRSYEYSTGYDLAVGNSSSSAFDIPFTGIVDAARVSRSIRTPAEIAAVWFGIADRIR